jgi:hypothetical protein
MPPLRQRREPGTRPGLGRAGASSVSFAVKRRRLAKWVVVLALACMAGTSGAQPNPPKVSLEYAVKATYLYKFAPFVNWPPDTFEAADAPFRICVVGDDPFKEFLGKAVAGQRLGTHPFEVRRMETIGPGAGCQIVFISRLRAQSLGAALASVNGEPVLTVTDSTIDPDSGSIVQFVIDNGRVRFDINTSAAARNHLTINSKLLNLALAVRDEH